MKKILFIFGTRPEAIKMVPIIKELERTNRFKYEICITAQHREMLDQVLTLFGIKADYDLNIMKPNQDLFDITSNILLKLKDVLSSSSPDIVLVHGDTTTTFSASLASFYMKIPIGHVEAGLRTHDLFSPFPEEANRQLTSRLASFHFAPTSASSENLLSEGVEKSKIFITGNTVIDTLLITDEKIKNSKEKQKELRLHIKNSGYKLDEKRVILVTGHRRENFGDGFISICKALKRLALANRDINIVYPLHLNPNVQGVVHEYLDSIENIYLINPLDYEPFVYLMSSSYIILTDSGGIQEEAPSLGKPILVMRNTTERPEAVDSGTVKLVGTDEELIVELSQKLLDDKSFYDSMSKIQNPYGDGKSSQRIIESLLKVL
ncbi:MAG: UDP-N-acetylglucosamine 2-epimerase (non-hydrolyzing) [Sulfurimonas sp.]|nr:UDP-N-acetylglucosamine 2-epimerase (non-hydrolyzing) [Sulfurimonas sp.]